MATININGTEHTLKFGIKALADLDTKYSIPVEGGFTLPMGLQTAITHLQLGNVTAIANLIQAGAGLREAQVAKFLEDDDTDMDVVFDAITEALEEGNLTKKFMSQLKDQVEAQK